ncbi:MAG: YHYH protein [Deltaproteobacteria bacterium]|nr:MAG: YHYH protein [Deltaproteobacteria bacterium]
MGMRGFGAMIGVLGCVGLVSACDPVAYDEGTVDEAAASAGDTLPGADGTLPGCPPPPGTLPPPGCPLPPALDDPTTADETSATSVCPQADDFALTGAPAGAAYPAPTLSASCTEAEVVVTSNGIPDFTFTQVTPNALTAQTHVWRFPRDPAPAAAPAAVPLGGPAAIAVNGLPIFGPTEAPQDGYRDPVLDELLDYCGGHTAPGGVYHFHARPDCLLEGLDGVPYVVLGYAFDGYPILSPWVCDDPACVSVREVQSGWAQVEAVYGASITNAWSAHAYVPGTSELDECNGMTLGDGRYAYFATDTFPYLLGCYRGTPTANGLAGGGLGGPGATPGGGFPAGAEE